MTSKLACLAVMTAALLSLAGCSKDPVPQKTLDAMDSRAKAMCACTNMVPKEATACVKTVNKESPEPTDDRPLKQEVSEESWAAYKGFRDVATKCAAVVRSASAAAGS